MSKQRSKKVRDMTRGKGRDSGVKKTKHSNGGMPVFIFFSMERRESVMKDNPDLSMTEIAKVLGKEWKTLSKEEKDNYNTKAKGFKKDAKSAFAKQTRKDNIKGQDGNEEQESDEEQDGNEEQESDDEQGSDEGQGSDDEQKGVVEAVDN